MFNDRIRIATCAAANTCRALAHWTFELNQPAAAGFTLHRPEFVAASNGREFLSWTEQSTNGVNLREVRLSTRCPGLAWGAEVHPWDAAAGRDEDAELGLPHLAYDDIDDTVHLVLLDRSAPMATPVTGDVIWARNTYAACN